MTSQGYAEVMADARTVMGESPAPIIAKSCLSPSELQPAEIVVLHAYYENKVTQITRLRMLELVADFGVPWQDIAAQQIVSVINTQPGQRWFDRNVRDLDAELSTIGAKVKEVIADCTQALTDGGP